MDSPANPVEVVGVRGRLIRRIQTRGTLTTDSIGRR